MFYDSDNHELRTSTGTLMWLATSNGSAGNEAWLRGEGPRDVVQEFESPESSPAVGLSLRGIGHPVAKDLRSHVVSGV